MRGLWVKVGLLDNAQNAYRAGRGTENALLEVINGLEEAQECATNIVATSWDKKRAFDTLSRNAARIALYRLGVPSKVCEMLVGLDIDEKEWSAHRKPRTFEINSCNRVRTAAMRKPILSSLKSTSVRPGVLVRETLPAHSFGTRFLTSY